MRFRVLHKKMGPDGFICQRQGFLGRWVDVGYKSLDPFSLYSEWEGCGTQEEAERRLDFEVEQHFKECELNRQKRAFRPKVVKEWP